MKFGQFMSYYKRKKYQKIAFIKCFDKKFSFVILHKPAKFHYQTVFTKLFSKTHFMFHG